MQQTYKQTDTTNISSLKGPGDGRDLFERLDQQNKSKEQIKLNITMIATNIQTNAQIHKSSSMQQTNTHNKQMIERSGGWQRLV